MKNGKDFRILSLDGGGSKGVYTLGILKELESLIGKRICDEFDLIYGTSTGSIIAALLSLGNSVDEITEIYFNFIPDVMQYWWSKKRKSEALKRNTEKIIGTTKFDSLKTDIGIVTMNYYLKRPTIFKFSEQQAHGRKATFESGFGCTIAEAIIASSAAYPFFEKVRVNTSNIGEQLLIDGGFLANNPTLYAIADAVNAYEIPKDKIKVLSLGVGIYNTPPLGRIFRTLAKLDVFELLPLFLTLLDANSISLDQLREILFKDISCIRISDVFNEKRYETTMLEVDNNKLSLINNLGKESFGKRENEIRKMFGW